MASAKSDTMRADPTTMESKMFQSFWKKSDTPKAYIFERISNEKMVRKNHSPPSYKRSFFVLIV
jgi:hypothetical protein